MSQTHRDMKIILRCLALALLAAVIAVAGALVLMVEQDAAVGAAKELDGRQVDRAKRILAQHDPRRLKPGDVRRLQVTGDDVALLITNAMARYAAAGADVALAEKRLDLTASLALPATPLGRYLNVHARFEETGAVPRLRSARVGELPLPGVLTEPAFDAVLNLIDERAAGVLSRNLIRAVRFSPAAVDIIYEWQPDVLEAVRGELMSPALSAEIVAQVQSLRAAPLDPGGGRSTLAALLTRLAETAAARDGDPVVENRALIIVAEAVVSGRNLGLLAPELAQLALPAARVTLRGRRDFARHYVISAALAVWSSSELADSVGIVKELEDSTGGSGFSFQDLAADRVGTRFARLATAGRAPAAALQRRLAGGVTDAQLMPDVADMPERLTAAAFKQRFGAVGSPAYEALSDQLNERIAALELYR